MLLSHEKGLNTDLCTTLILRTYMLSEIIQKQRQMSYMIECYEILEKGITIGTNLFSYVHRWGIDGTADKSDIRKVLGVVVEIFYFLFVVVVS